MRFSSSRLPFESLSLIVARSEGLFVTGGWRVTTPPFNPHWLKEEYGSISSHDFGTESTASTKKEKRRKKERKAATAIHTFTLGQCHCTDYKEGRGGIPSKSRISRFVPILMIVGTKRVFGESAASGLLTLALSPN